MFLFVANLAMTLFYVNPDEMVDCVLATNCMVRE